MQNTENRPAIVLDTPIKRGDTEITEIQLRKPLSGELRGLALTEVLQMQVQALTELLPRISTPTLTKHEVSSMDPADLVQCGQEIAGFFLTREQRAGLPSR